MALKKRSSVSMQEEGPKKRRKEAVQEEPVEVKKKSKKKKERAPKVEEERLSHDDYDENSKEADGVELEDHHVEEDEEVNSDMEMKEDHNEIGWPQADMIELFNKIEATLPGDDTLNHVTRANRLDWAEIAFNNYSPAECQRVWTEIHKRIRQYRLLKEVVGDARKWVYTPWTSFYKAAKKNVHPDMPRRPLSQYMLYYVEKKDKVSRENPDLDMVQLSKLVSQMYQALSASKKEKYMHRAAQLREEYNEKLRLFHQQHPEYETALIKAGSKKGNLKSNSLPLGLRKPKSAQQKFIDHRLEKMKNQPSFDRNEAIAKAKEKWQSLPDKSRLVWINWALEEEAKYLEKLKLYQAENPNMEPAPFKTVLKKEELALRDRAAGKPAKPANSAYSLYSRLMLAKCPDLKELVPKTRMKEIAIRWKEMPDEEKEEYGKKVKYEQERYKLEYATYLESLPDDERQEELIKSQSHKVKKPVKEVELTKDKEVNNGKKANKSKSKKSSKKGSGDAVKKVERQYFPGEPHQPPVNAYDLFVDSFVTDTKLDSSEAPRFWEMLPSSDKSKFQRKLKDLKEKYIKDYKKFLKSLDEEQVAKYNELQKRNKEREAAAEAQKAQNSDDSDDSSSEDEEHEAPNNTEKEVNDDSDEDENEEETKKSDSSSDSSSSSGGSSSSSSSSDDSDSSSDDSDDEDKTAAPASKKGNSDSDSSDDE